MSKINLILYEDLNNKVSVLYDKRNKCYYVYSLIIPKRLLEEINLSKEVILRYHTEPVLIKKGRGEPNEDKFKRIIKEYIKEYK